MKKYFFYLRTISISFILILICSGFDDKDSKIKEGVKIIKKQLDELSGRRMRISGEVLDDKGNPLSDVMVEIRKMRIIELSLKIAGKEETEKKTLKDSKFKYDFTGWHDVFITFSKEGYYSMEQDLILDDTEETNSYIKDDVKIVLREIGCVVEDLREGWMLLGIDISNKDKVVKKGWNPEKQNSDATEDIEYKDPSEVEFYIEKDDSDPNSIMLKSNGKGGFILFSGEARNLTYLNEAPDIEYFNSLKLPIENGKELYFYFKTNNCKFGKMRGEIRGDDSRSIIEFSSIYVINPDGSRNLCTTKE